MKPVLIIGGSGFIGGRLATALLHQSRAIRCLTRSPAKLTALAAVGAEVVPGDIADAASVLAAVAGTEAVYVAIHTLSVQSGGAAKQRFMDVEIAGLRNVVAACRDAGVRRVVYVTSLGTAADEPSEWLRERWRAERMLLDSGLDVTVIRPGLVVGRGGRGFDTMLANAGKRLAFTLGGERPTMRTIAVDDLVGYLIGVLDDPRSLGHGFDVGNDEVLSINQLVDGIADVLGRPHPRKIQMPRGLLRALSPTIERLAKMPPGAMSGMVDSLATDLIGDPLPIRGILPRPLLSYRQAVERALAET